MVHRLDQDEYEFLAALEDKGRQEELLKQREEELALAAYREAVSSLRESKPAAPRSAEPDSSNAGPKQKGESQRAQKRPLVLDRLGSLVRVPKKARDAAETNSKSRPSPQQGPDEGGGADKPRVDKPRDTEPGKSALASLLGAYGDSEEGEEGNESGAEL
ncbi:hypothetical protein EV182_004037 [Spiromyces aspiralis]|uniref:Uncharacterized protein n=1 Tax=Spiromyces aspiralis TaxID=68401 RepID=A0ACC1HX28_9FUNG|nr:hypothetical protein EV182_004037 [Spiromyces aspiralis]